LLIFLSRPSTSEKPAETHPVARPPKLQPIEPIVIEKAAEPVRLPEPTRAEPVPEVPAYKREPAVDPAVTTPVVEKKDRAHRRGPVKEKPLSDKAKPTAPAVENTQEEGNPERW
jgi:hypothetical protein